MLGVIRDLDFAAAQKIGKRLVMTGPPLAASSRLSEDAPLALFLGERSEEVSGTRSSNAGVIYDFGMHDGSDLEYYLKKGLKVVSVEANPDLCTLVSEAYRSEIEMGRLTVVNVALSSQDSGETDFYIHKSNDVLSQLPRPAPEVLDEFEVRQIGQRRASSVIVEHGTPHYVKIDLEHYDHIVLRELFSAGIFPDHISAEFWTIEVFALLVTAGYTAFNLLDGRFVPLDYGDAVIATPHGPLSYAFPPHSAGPFGDDIASPWWDKEAFASVLVAEGLGWRDIHASKIIPPRKFEPQPPVMPLRHHMKDLLPSWKRGREYLARWSTINAIYKAAGKP